MKKSLMALGVGTLMVVTAASILHAQKTATGKEKKVIFVSAKDAAFKRSTSKGVNMEVLWGDPDKGAHATFTKFEPGYDAGMHSHSNDVWIAVIKGAYLYKDDDGEKHVGPGDFLRVPGGHKHWSGGDKTDGALFYEEGSGKFDLTPAK